MVFNYVSVYALLVFLLKRNPFLGRRWPRAKIDEVRKMSRSVALRKLRGVLCAAAQKDIIDAHLQGYFWNRDLLDTVVRVLRLRNWHTNPIFSRIFSRRCKFLKFF